MRDLHKRFSPSTAAVLLHEGLMREQGPPSRVFQAPGSERCRQFLASHL